IVYCGPRRVAREDAPRIRGGCRRSSGFRVHDVLPEDGLLRARALRALGRGATSRLLESGAMLAEVQVALGHVNITLMSRYLGVTDQGCQRAFARLEQYAGAMNGSR